LKRLPTLPLVAPLLALFFAGSVLFGAWTPPRTWNANEVVTAAMLNIHVRDNLLLLKTSINDDGTIDPLDGGYVRFARKTTDQAVNTTAALVNVTDLTLPIGANETWIFRFVIHGLSGTVPDWQFAVVVPSGSSSVRYGLLNFNRTIIDANTSRSTSGAPMHVGAMGFDEMLLVEGLVVNGASAGNIQLQFAQSTAAGGATTVYANSYGWAERVG
jgi:hypothetical protein